MIKMNDPLAGASGALNFPPRVAGGWTRMAITFPANQGSQGLVSEASVSLKLSPSRGERPPRRSPPRVAGRGIKPTGGN